MSSQAQPSPTVSQSNPASPSELAPENRGPAAPSVLSPSDGAGERRQIAKRAGVVAAGTLASRLLGLVREQVLAAVFTRAATDAFFVAFTIPNVLRQLLAEGAVQTAVLPILAQTREAQGDAEARRFFRAVRGLSLLVLLIVTVLGVALAGPLVEVFAGGYHDIPGQYERTVTLTRWVFPYIFFMGTAALGMAALNTHHRFVATSFAPGLLNVAFIVAALALPTWLATQGYDPLLALAVGVLGGGVLQVVAQWPSLKAIGYLERPSLELGHPGVVKALARMTPVLFGIGVYYIDVVLARRFLSELGVGAQSYFNFALRLCDFPQGIFVMALQTATLPSLARLAARGELAEVSKTFGYGMRMALFVALPASVLFVVLADPLVVLIFQRGAFDPLASHETARALMAQGFGIWMVAGVRQLVATYYALGDTRTPVLVSAVDLLVFVGLALALRAPLGHVGISLAVTGSSAVQLALLWLLLRRRLANVEFAQTLQSVGRTVLATLPAAVVAGGLAALFSPCLKGNAAARLVPGAVAASAFGVVFLATAWILRSEEMHSVLRPITRRLRQRASRSD